MQQSLPGLIMSGTSLTPFFISCTIEIVVKFFMLKSLIFIALL
ncbi:hypothetical protein [Wolbachia endosymbiont (group B) of Ischnura elegans]|nr:hypothetical protein [Wolbachia endosymbiont (group B) of Ischnura elegans]